MALDPVVVRRARARAQLLDVPALSVPDAVHRLVGVQAQDARAAALAIRARTTGCTASSVGQAIAAGELVLTWTLRGTRHLHLRDDVAWLLALFGPRYGRPTKRDAELGIAGETGERAVAALRSALDASGPLTRAEVKDRLAPIGVEPDGQAVIHVIRRAALAGVLSVVPGEGRVPERYAPLHTGRPGVVDPVAELVRRYLRGYGPATPADAAVWSGLGRRAVEAVWSRPGASSPGPSHAARPVPLRLVGGFDNLLLGYADRSPHLAAEHAGAVNAGGGLIRPLVVDDGRVVGTWTIRDGIEPFPGERFDASAEFEAMQQFLAG